MVFLVLLGCFDPEPVSYDAYLDQVAFFSDTGPQLAGICPDPVGEARDVAFVNRTNQSIALEWVDEACVAEPWTGLMFIDDERIRSDARPGDVYRILSASTLVDFIPEVLDERVLGDEVRVEVIL